MFLQIPSTKLPIGRNSWDLKSEICSGEIEDPSEAEFTISSCGKNQFTCNDGKCKPLDDR